MICLILLLAVMTAHADSSEWDLRLVPEGGIGTTIMQSADFTVALGARIGHFPADWPLIGEREFGWDLANVEGNWATGPWIRLFGNSVSFVGYVWQEKRHVTGDFAVRYSVPLNW